MNGEANQRNYNEYCKYGELARLYDDSRGKLEGGE